MITLSRAILIFQKDEWAYETYLCTSDLQPHCSAGIHDSLYRRSALSQNKLPTLQPAFSCHSSDQAHHSKPIKNTNYFQYETKIKRKFIKTDTTEFGGKKMVTEGWKWGEKMKKKFARLANDAKWRICWRKWKNHPHAFPSRGTLCKALTRNFGQTAPLGSPPFGYKTAFYT